MYSLFIVLNKSEKLDEVLELFFDYGVGGTVIESTGMGKVLLDHNIHENIFSSLKNILNEGKPYNKTIFSVIEDEITLDLIIEKIDQLLDLSREKSSGFLFALPVVKSRGGFNSSK